MPAKGLKDVGIIYFPRETWTKTRVIKFLHSLNYYKPEIRQTEIGLGSQGKKRYFAFELAELRRLRSTKKTIYLSSRYQEFEMPNEHLFVSFIDFIE